LSHHSTQFEARAGDYTSLAVEMKLQQWQEFQYADEFSRSLLRKENRQVVTKGETKLGPEKNCVLYSGEWADQDRHGRGFQVWPDGSRYDGYFINDRQRGFGRMIYSSGDVYLGYWHNDKSNGQGELTDKDGSKFSGFWQDNVLDGKGEMTSADGSSYVGDF